MTKSIITSVLVGLFILISSVNAEMSSTNYQIRWDSMTAGGSDTSTSANYGVHDSISGDAAMGDSVSSNYRVTSGYRAGSFDQLLTFNTFFQNVSDNRIVSARSGLTISTADTTSLLVGDYVVLIQDIGTAQTTAIGKITSVSSGVSITVDAWADNGSTPTIDGTNDFVAPLSASSIAFGTLSSSAVKTATIGFDVYASLDNGYNIQLMQGGNLTTGSTDITAVADGSVSAGATEYGARSSDITLASSSFDTADAAITTSFQEIVTQSTPQFADRHFLVLKVGMASAATGGSYSQTLSIIASGNF